MMFDILRLALVLAIVTLMAGAMGDGPTFHKTLAVELFK